MSDGEKKRRRGRPRISDEDRRNNTLTCRVRDDLRDVVEEIAQANGRTVSEQLEYYIDACIREEARLTYEYSLDALSPKIFKYLNAKEQSINKNSLSVSFSAEHKEMITIRGKNYINDYNKSNRKDDDFSVQIGKIFIAEGHESVNHFAKAVIDATRLGTIRALKDILGPSAKDVPALLDVPGITNVRAVLTELAPLNRPLREEIDSMRADLVDMGDAVRARATQDEAIRFVLKKAYGIDWAPEGAEEVLQHNSPPKNIDDEIAVLMGRSILRSLNRANHQTET